MKLILLYLPVLHRGYLDFLQKHADPDAQCVLLGRAALEALGEEARYIVRKDAAIRGLPDDVACSVLAGLRLFGDVRTLDPSSLPSITSLVCPDEDVSQLAAKHFFPGVPVLFDGALRLRYDRKGVARVDPVPETSQMTSEMMHQELMGQAGEAAKHSLDWWLQVGALIARDGVPLVVAYNKAVPDPGMTSVMGDPRSLYSRGEGTDDTLVLHAERDVVAEAAYHGIALKGTDAYVTHFPCLPCAESLAKAGIKRLFFKNGYSRLESASAFTTRGIEIIRVV